VCRRELERGRERDVLADSTLIARSLGRVQWFMLATPAYLKKRGRPREPDDLKEHEWLMFGSLRGRTELHLERGEKSMTVSVTPRLMVTDNEVLHAATLAGLGIGLLPAFQCIEDLRAKRLERVLREWSTPATPMHVVYPSTRHLSPKVKSFTCSCE